MKFTLVVVLLCLCVCFVSAVKTQSKTKDHTTVKLRPMQRKSSLFCRIIFSTIKDHFFSISESIIKTTIHWQVSVLMYPWLFELYTYTKKQSLFIQHRHLLLLHVSIMIIQIQLFQSPEREENQAICSSLKNDQ